MRVEHLERWLVATRKSVKEEKAAGEETMEVKESTEPMEASNWERVVDMVQTTFREGRLAKEATWKAVALIPKVKRNYRGIGLLEVMWKVVAFILNRCFTSSTIYHNALHGFRAGRGTGTATLEAKLLQQLAAMREEVL